MSFAITFSSASAAAGCRRCHRQQQQQQQRRQPINLIGSFIPVVVWVFLLSIAVLTTTTTTTALSSSPLFSSSQSSTTGPDDHNNHNNIIAITHAAGRMGKVLALQLREDAELRYRMKSKSSSSSSSSSDSEEKKKKSDDDDDGDDVSSHLNEYLPKIRAIVRNEQEAYSVRCDLGGMTMMSGEVGGSSITKPIELEWLETVVVDASIMDDNERAVLLRASFEGCRAAILCDASHNEIVWTDEEENCTVVNGDSLASMSSSLSSDSGPTHGHTDNNEPTQVFPDSMMNNDNDLDLDCSGGYSLIVPAKEKTEALSRGLLEEIDAASSSSTLEHVILRSTMGLAVSKAAAVYRMYVKQSSGVGGIPVESVLDWDALATAMGGEAAISGARNAERAFCTMAEERKAKYDEQKKDQHDSDNETQQSQQQPQPQPQPSLKKCKYTILRLGALTDDAGMVPLVFGKNDSILIKTADDGTTNNRPPILSRADAARISTFLVRKHDDHDVSSDRDSDDTDNDSDSDSNDDDLYGNNDDARDDNNLTTIDCAWHPKFGRDSVGREETISRAGRQDLKKDMVEALLEQDQATINLQQDLV